MANLIVVGFKSNELKAKEVLSKLGQLDEDHVIDLFDAVAAHRDSGGQLRVDKRYDLPTSEGAILGGFWGLLFGAVLAIPLTAGASAAAVGVIAAGIAGIGAVGAGVGVLTADWRKEGFGISDDFVREVSSIFQPGDSAIFAVLNGEPAEVVSQFEGYGGKVLATSLTDEQKAKIEKVLNRGAA
jgi:uncharacterized membrane protein